MSLHKRCPFSTAICLPLIATLFALCCVPAERAFAQAGMREALVKLDRNKDGRISPSEITPLARPYIERIARARRMDLGKPNEIDRLLDAARIYYALRNGVSGRDIRPGGKKTVIPFGPKHDEPLIPQFGIGSLRYRYVKADLEEANRTMRRYDANRDGFIDVIEASRNRWTHRDPFNMDLNKDGRLSKMELVQRYARRRMLEGSSQEVWRKARRIGGLMPRKRRVRTTEILSDDERRRRNFERNRRDGNYWLARTIVGRFDANRNGRLEADEADRAGLSIPKMDSNKDGVLAREELHSYFSQQDRPRLTPKELPGWFNDLDKNKDNQIAMSEYTKDWTPEKFEEFMSMDRNNDGFLTMAEATAEGAVIGGSSFFNRRHYVLPSRKTIIADLDIPSDLIVDSVKVQLSITHTFVSALDGYLIGPKGQRVELFTGVGGRDDHFERTIFDDEAKDPISRARPPFRGTFKPESAERKQPSLNQFKGKSAKGTWRLVIRGQRSDRHGMLHSWGLIIKPQKNRSGASTQPAAKAPPTKSAATKRAAANKPTTAAKR